jgi:hypothetical protein
LENIIAFRLHSGEEMKDFAKYLQAKIDKDPSLALDIEIEKVRSEIGQQIYEMWKDKGIESLDGCGVSRADIEGIVDADYCGEDFLGDLYRICKKCGYKLAITFIKESA